MKTTVDTTNQTKILFSDFFNIDERKISEYGAYNVSLVADLPLFIDPFRLFNSKDEKYQELHNGIIKYLRFLKDKSTTNSIPDGLLKAWYYFGEVKQNWFGFTESGNHGHGLGKDFANALNSNFYRIFSDYGQENISKGSHLEKLCLIKDRVGKDDVSDFTTNLIKDFLLEYTQSFAKKYLDKELCENFRISKAKFNYQTEDWEEGTYYLPKFKNDFVILTPKNMLTREDTWINRTDLINDFYRIPDSVSNEELRSKIDNYLLKVLPDNPTTKERKFVAEKTIREFPELLDYYIKYKEEHGDSEERLSTSRVAISEELYLENFKHLSLLLNQTPFYKIFPNSYDEAIERAKYLKQVIENNDGYRCFYNKKGVCIAKEEDLKVLYRLTWFKTEFDVNTEVNNGRGPVDTKVSKGSADKSLVEFKLASNTQLEKNLRNQLPIYQNANNTNKAIKVIIYFTYTQLIRVQKILKLLSLQNEQSIIMIDSRKDNKVSASKATTTN